MIGKTLGHFQIEAKAGAGGMGEVYRARDTRLNRTVAIKVLPADLAADPALRDRLKREAIAISRLNHPHVCTLYDIGHADGVDFLVLEYLEGTLLSYRLDSGPMPLKDALAVAAQVADGLDAAHRLGIVHRDLKPGNVMLTSGGAKLLDFGLAKEHTGPGGAGSMMATRPVSDVGDPATAEGTILGTLKYMSPEQLHGEPVDARSDLFSFGAMLYEMVTGEAPFSGKSQASVIASILEKEPPPVSERAPIAPKALERLIARCLCKDPESRYQNARDVMHELQWIAAEGLHEEAAPSRTRSVLLPVLGAVGATVVVLGLAARLVLGPGIFSARGGKAAVTPEPVVRATIPLPQGHRIAGWASPTVAISDDGRAIAFVTVNPEGEQHLYVRPLDGSESILVPDSETAEGPVFSPDGKWVLFAVGVSGPGTSRKIPAELRKYSLESGLTQTLCPTGDYFGADWGDDGTIIWTGTLPEGLWRVQPDGGDPENFLTSSTVDGETHPVTVGWPALLPDRRHMLVSLPRGAEFDRGAVLDLETGRSTSLGINTAAPRLLADGRLVWVDDKGTLMVAPFDTGTYRIVGSGRAVDRGISLGGVGCPVFAVSRNGTAVFARGPISGSGRDLRQLVRLELDGTRTPLSIEPGPYKSFALSPDGSQVLLATNEALRIQNLNRSGTTEVPLAGVSMYAWRIAWSADARLIAFPGIKEEGSTITAAYVVSVDGMSPPRLAYAGESETYPFAWEPDGRHFLAVDWTIVEKKLRLRVIRVTLDDGPPTELDLGEFLDVPSLGSRGDRIAYVQPQGSTSSVIVRSYPELGSKFVAGSGNYRSVVWSGDEKKLYAFAEDGVDEFTLDRGPEWKVTKQRRLLSGIGRVRMAAPVPGGTGFYILEEVPGSGIVDHLEVVVNWTASLPSAKQ